jgi:type I restriction enzyme, S subunit
VREVALRRIFRIVNGGTPTSDPSNWDGDVPWATPVDLARVNGGVLEGTRRTLTRHGLRSGSAAISAGSLIVSTRAPIGYVAEVRADTALNQGCRGLVPWVEIDSRFFRYQLGVMAGLLEGMGSGSTFLELSSDALAEVRLVAPDRGSQRAIAGYLDKETVRIDGVIERRTRMTELLHERHRTVVRTTIAAAAEAVPLKRHWRIIDCKHRTPDYATAGYPVVSPGDVTPGRLDLRRCHRFVGERDFADLTEGRRPRMGDIVYSRNASIGTAALVTSDEPFTMGQDVCLITSEHEDQRFLTYTLNSLGADQLGSMKIGSTFGRVNIPQIAELLIPTPDAASQRAIADCLDVKSMRVRNVTDALAKQVSLLREHRQALITAAVTGQIDVTKGAA